MNELEKIQKEIKEKTKEIRNMQRKNYKRQTWQERADNKSKVLICPIDMSLMKYVSGNQNAKNYKCLLCNTMWSMKIEN